MSIGDWSWAQRTQGRLSRRDEQHYVMSIARAGVASALARHLRSPWRRADYRAVAIALPESPPDSAFARAALTAAQERSTPGLLAHSIRAWLWADLLAQAGQVRHDPELLYAACLLHDLGLTDQHWMRRSDCFAVEGAMAAHDLAREHGYFAADALAEAVSLHLNVSVPLEHGPEAHLLHAGTTTDLFGGGFRRIPRDLRHEVLRRHPRHDLETEVLEPVRRQAQLRPRSRIAVLEQRAGFTDRVIQAAPRFG